MTPDAVVYRYLELLSLSELDVDAFCRFVACDADLLNHWLQILDLPVDTDAFNAAMHSLPPGDLRRLAGSQAVSSSAMMGSARLSLDLWQSVLRSAYLGEFLYIAASDENVTPASRTNLRLRMLLGLSGVSLGRDDDLHRLAEFRGVNPGLLEDASLMIRIFAVLDGIEVNRDGELAGRLLSIEEDAYGKLMVQAEEASNSAVAELGIDVDPDANWHDRLWLRRQIESATAPFAGCTSLAELADTHALVCRSLFNTSPLLLIMTASQHLRLVRHDDVRIARDSATSEVAAAVRAKRNGHLLDRPDAAVADRELLHFLGSEEGLVVVGEDAQCVLIVDQDEDLDAEAAATLYLAALLPHLKRIGSAPTESEATGDDREAVNTFRNATTQRLRELVHEASNPLSIVHNYLHILELKLQQDPEVVEQLQLVRNELQRAGDIFARARRVPAEVEDLANSADTRESIDLSAWLRGLVELHRGLANERAVVLRLHVPDDAVVVEQAPGALAQIVTNLLKNALEACGREDQVTVRLKPTVFRRASQGVEIAIVDSGPGLPAAVMANLAEPKTSSKGGEHQGVGMQVAYRLAAEHGVEIDCETSASGTEFRLYMSK